MTDSNQFSFGCTALMGTNKAGIVKPDEFGYRTMVLGAFNAFNSADQFYPDEPALELFRPDSALMRRIKSGSLHGELGHPRKLPGMSDRDFLMRIADIVEQNICVHIAEVTLIPRGMVDEAGRPVTGVIGKIKGAGPHGDVLEADLNNPKQNVCFSIRSITNDRWERGRYTKYLRAVYTWDKVNEPGISIAKKWHSPALEQLQEVFMDEAAIRSIARAVAREGKDLGAESQQQSVIKRLMQDLGMKEESGASKKTKIYMPTTANW